MAGVGWGNGLSMAYVPFVYYNILIHNVNRFYGGESVYWTSGERTPPRRGPIAATGRFWDSLLPQQDRGIDGESTLGWNPGSEESEQRHGQDRSGQYEWIAGSCLIDDECEYAA